jgi:hypothetical protein
MSQARSCTWMVALPKSEACTVVSPPVSTIRVRKGGVGCDLGIDWKPNTREEYKKGTHKSYVHSSEASARRTDEVISGIIALGQRVLRYGLALVIGWIGAMKFTGYREDQARSFEIRCGTMRRFGDLGPYAHSRSSWLGRLLEFIDPQPIATSHTRLWPASGWECRGRRLSRA